MYQRPTRRRTTLRIEYPVPPSSVRIRSDRTRAAVHHPLRSYSSSPCALPASGFACVSLSSCICCECPCALGHLVPFCTAFSFPAAPAVRFHCVSILFDCARIALPYVSLSIEPVCSLANFQLSSHGLRQRREPTCIPHYPSVPLRCRCHVTHTNWSRALAASSLVAQDTTHPHNTLISPPVRERSEDLTPSLTNLRLTDCLHSYPAAGHI